MPAYPRPSRAAMDDVFEDAGAALQIVTRADIRRFRSNAEDARSDAADVFLATAAGFRADRGNFLRALVFRVHDRARADRRTRARRASLLRRWAQSRDFGPKWYEPPEAFSMNEFSAPLSQDARLVMRVLFHERTLDIPIQTDPNLGPPSILRHLTHHLVTQHGWGRPRVEAAYAEIRTAWAKWQ